MKQRFTTSLMILLLPFSFSAGSLSADEGAKAPSEKVRTTKGSHDEHRDVVKERQSSNVKVDKNVNDDNEMSPALKAALRRTQDR